MFFDMVFEAVVIVLPVIRTMNSAFNEIGYNKVPLLKKWIVFPFKYFIVI